MKFFPLLLCMQHKLAEDYLCSASGYDHISCDLEFEETIKIWSAIALIEMKPYIHSLSRWIRARKLHTQNCRSVSESNVIEQCFARHRIWCERNIICESYNLLIVCALRSERIKRPEIMVICCAWPTEIPACKQRKQREWIMGTHGMKKTDMRCVCHQIRWK